MDSLIQRECTGSPSKFARKLELSRATFFEYLAYLRDELMVDVRYDEYRETYYYGDNDFCSALGNKRCSVCLEKHYSE
ncbi:hypothetical protein [uncultured Parabacteroides sp.]|uniref:hypothetical protein n=1 Tax=uncultured Parabacteroides sp. TaxID=512312 RepID=UPI002805ECDE|nr:hypothetical protein [uncultured Parabacteroides sp.]